MVDLTLDKALDDGEEVGGFIRMCRVPKRPGIVDDGDLVKLVEPALDDKEVGGVHGVEGGPESGRVLVTGNGKVVEVTREEDGFVEHAVDEFPGEDFGTGVHADTGAAHGVGRVRAGGGGVGAVDGDFTGGEVDSGEPLVEGQVGASVDVAGKVVSEAAGGEPVVDVVVYGEVHVGAVPVRPARGERSAAPEHKVVLAPEVVAERMANGFEEFAGAARKVELGHQRVA